MYALQIAVSEHKYLATLAYLGSQWACDKSVTVTQYPMRKIAQSQGLSGKRICLAWKRGGK